MNALDIKWLHVEPSSRCNAYCPACPRNNGSTQKQEFIQTDLDTEKFEVVVKSLYNLETIQFCGNLGEPVIAHNFLDLIHIAKKHCTKIQIHTNGSLRNITWWKELAALLQDIEHNVWFGIDGINDIHAIYRQGTDYTKIIDNASSFINNGGHATWQFIPFDHNKHQILECMRLSQQLGFKNFKFVKSYRQQQQVNNIHWRTKENVSINTPNEVIHLLRKEQNIEAMSVQEKDCMHLSYPSVYLSALGKLSTCCYFGNIQWYDDVYQLLESKLDLTHHRCLESCGL